jgi:purine nucleosidase
VGAAWGFEPHKRIPIVLGLNLTEHIAMTPIILSRLATAAESSSVPMIVLDDRGTRSVGSDR